jgi:hypothetical protein
MMASSSGTRLYLLGLVHGHWDVKAEAGDVLVDDEVSPLEGKINMGMAIVIPFYKITEVLNQPKFQSHRDTYVEEKRKESLPTPDAG